MSSAPPSSAPASRTRRTIRFFAFWLGLGQRGERPEQAIDAVFTAVEQFTAGAPPEDDITVVALKLL